MKDVKPEKPVLGVKEISPLEFSEGVPFGEELKAYPTKPGVVGNGAEPLGRFTMTRCGAVVRLRNPERRRCVRRIGVDGAVKEKLERFMGEFVNVLPTPPGVPELVPPLPRVPGDPVTPDRETEAPLAEAISATLPPAPPPP